MKAAYFSVVSALRALVLLGLVLNFAGAFDSSALCATLYDANEYGGRIFPVGDGKQVVNFEDEHISAESVWNSTASFKVVQGCLLTACNETYFDGTCVQVREPAPTLPAGLDYVQSANCTCKKDCKCSDIQLRMRRGSCGRAYVGSDCNTCNAHYTELKGEKEVFPEEFGGRVKSLLVRPGCSLTIFDEEDYEGESEIFTGVVENYTSSGQIGSYQCTCDPNKMTRRTKAPRNPAYPPWIDLPSTLDDVSKMVNGEEGRHPALMAALTSLKHKRSPRNAYILLIGISGSGKSSAINLLFDNPNVTRVGSEDSTTSSIHEFRIPVPVDELGILNSELRVIDTPGLADTKGPQEDAKFLATLDDYLANHAELHNRIPNVILIFHKFHDNRYAGPGSQFVKVLAGLESFRTRLTDKSYSNVIFVFSHFTSETKEIQRKPGKKLSSFKRVIEDYSQFPPPISMVVAENKAPEQGLPLVHGYYKLPNGEYYPRNLFDKIQLTTSSCGDPIGEAVITAAFRDSDDFNITSTAMSLVGSGSSKVARYFAIISGAIFQVEMTDVSKLLASAYETLSPELKKKFPDALLYIQKSMNMRNIRTAEDVPRTALDIIRLLTSLKLNEATLYLLEKGLSIKPPILKENPVAGYSYNVFKDTPLPVSPLKLDRLMNTDTGYSFPAVMSCIVERKGAEIFKIFENKNEYLDYRLQTLNTDGKIPLESFSGDVRPGCNIKGLQITTNGSAISALRELQTFEIVLNDRLELTPEFESRVRSLVPYNQSDHESVDSWKSFFNEYGTHVVKSVHAGGSIEIQLTTAKPFGADITQALFDLVQFAEDLDVGRIGNKSLKWDGVGHAFKFRGGDQAYHTSDLTRMSLAGATELLEKWKESLSFSPVILGSSLRLLPLSELTKRVGQNVSSEIQRATDLYFKSSLKYVRPARGPAELPPDRGSTEFSTASAASQSMFMELISKMMEEGKRADERFQGMMLKMEEDRKRSEEQRELGRQEQVRWERDQAARREAEKREDLKAAREAELRREEMKLKYELAQKEAEERRRVQDEAQRAQMQRMAQEHQRQQMELMTQMANRPQPSRGGGGGCLVKGTRILLADYTERRIEEVEVGDMVLDHDLRPTRVVAAMEKYLLRDRLFGFSSHGPFFFTSTHLFGGPGKGPERVQLLVQSLPSFLAENPLMEYLNVEEMIMGGGDYLIYNRTLGQVGAQGSAIFPEPNPSPPDTPVHIIEVESEAGTYIANGFVCHHEMPPLDRWPNTVQLLANILGDPNIARVEEVPYTLESVARIEEIVEETTERIAQVLANFVPANESAPLSEEGVSYDQDEVIRRLFSSNTFSALGLGLYGTTAKMLSTVLDGETRLGSAAGDLENLSRLIQKLATQHVIMSLERTFNY